MRSHRMSQSLSVLIVALVALAPTVALAQGATSGSITGLVVSADDSGQLPGATVVAVHEPTGTRYTTLSREDGSFRILNARVGSPYRIFVVMSGFQDFEQGDLAVRLGEDLNLSITMRLEPFTEELTVVAETSGIFSPYRTGATANVSADDLASLPSVTRTFEDFARTSVYFNPVSQNDGASSMSVAGRNNRYNNIQIDGAVNNDLFGLAAQGTPGGQAEALPISLDAIQELQLLISPYDIRQGGFSGGGVNAITKSGSNEFHGTAFYYTRDDSFVGDREFNGNDVPFGEFSNDQFGFSLGGPIVQDKVFFFLTGEFDRKDNPAGYSIGGTGQDWGHSEEAEQFRDILVTQYGYDPGGFEETTRTTDADLFFGRVDVNLAGSHQLVFRHNYVDAANLLAYPSSRTYYMPDNFYEFSDQTNSTVLQLNSAFANNVFNEARITYQTIEDQRGGPTAFPQVSVTLPDGAILRAGREQFSTANSLDQDILEIHDDLTLSRGDHTFTIGTHNELFSFKNVFIRDNFGVYAFDSLANFAAGYAYQYSYSFSNTADPQQASEFDVQQFGLYAGDEWAVKPNLTLTYGVRVDAPFFPDEPTYNPRVYELYGVDTSEMASGNMLWSPRVGFNWDITGEGKRQLRGGTGIFAGRTPYVWMSNQYGNTGVEFTRISANRTGTVDANNSILFEPDPFNQPTNIGSAASNEINAMDPDFEFPQVWRTSLAYDHALGWWGLVGTVEAIYSKTIKDILYQDLNLEETGTLADGRPSYARQYSDYAYLIWLTNTSKGRQYSLALNLHKPFDNGFTADLGYVYGDSQSVNDGTSSQATSNWRYLPVSNPNDPSLSTSNFNVEHRFVLTTSYSFNITDAIGSTVALYYNHQAGRPYSTTYSRDMNGDFQDNDLIYVPASADEVIIQNGTWEQLDNYIEADAGLRDARGEIVERNASVAPWTHTLDLHYGVDFQLGPVNTEVTMDILNLSNLLNSDWGQVKYVGNSEISPIRHRGYDAATGKPIYELLITDPDKRWSYDDLRSRWQAKLGLRLSF